MSNNLPKAYIFGAGAVGNGILPSVKKQYDVIAFLDNDMSKWDTLYNEIPVIRPESIQGSDYDRIFVASFAGVNTIVEQLLDMGISRDLISTEYNDYPVKSRIVFLDNLGVLFHERGIAGSIAECGVFQGEFACELNRVFPDKRLYLFDTFSGFDKRDMELEFEKQYSKLKAGHFNITNEELVLGKLPNPKMCVVRKGYFPETARDIDELFCLVNLDFDLYNPTLAGLEFFYPRMVKGGVILVHDYFSTAYRGVRDAVRDFESATDDIHFIPIGDGLSIAILC